MLENLYPLSRTLKIDSLEIFCPEIQQHDTAFRQLRLLLKGRTKEEIASLFPNLSGSTISMLKPKEAIQIE